MTRIAAESFARTVANMAAYPVGVETSFGAGSAHVEVWRPLAGTWVLSLIEVSEDMAEVARLRTVAIVPSATRTFDVISGDGSVTLGEFRGIEAALGHALDYVAAPAWFAGAQSEPDLVSC